jgi:hypothetical protein
LIIYVTQIARVVVSTSNETGEKEFKNVLACQYTDGLRSEFYGYI